MPSGTTLGLLATGGKTGGFGKSFRFYNKLYVHFVLTWPHISLLRYKDIFKLGDKNQTGMRLDVSNLLTSFLFFLES